jgi:site-specific DNA recombinase
LIRHKNESYSGGHPAIIDRGLWNNVQSLRDDNIQGTRRKVRATKESLFVGILSDAAGTLYTPTHANKNGRRYRYYTSQAVMRKTVKSSSPARIPAHDLETAILDRILVWLQTPKELLASLRDETTTAVPEGFFARLIAQAAETAKHWFERSATDRTRFLKAILGRVVIYPAHVEIRLSVPTFVNEIIGEGLTVPNLPLIVTIDTQFRHVQQGRALRLVVGNTNITTDASRLAILMAVARARLWYEQVTIGEANSIAELACLHGISSRFIRIQMKLVQLSPRSIECLLNQPESLPLSLDDLLAAVPMKWSEQTIGSSLRIA